MLTTSINRGNDVDLLRSTTGHAATLHRFGSRAHRVAFIGDDPVLGVGTGSSESALPGLVADLLTPRTQRGLDADLFTGPEWNPRAVAGGADALRLGRYDAVVLAFAPPSRLLPSRRRRWIRAALNTVLVATHADTEVVVLSMAGSDGDTRRARARQFIEEYRDEIVRSGAALTVIDGPAESEQGRPTALASALATRLAEHMADRGGAWRFRDSADDEAARQRAVEASGILDLEDDGLVQVLLDRARRAFGTPNAFLNVIDGGREWHAASADGQSGEGPREDAFCNITIQRADPFVVRDAPSDPNVNANPNVQGDDPVRFYAGVPIESADGYRIGALCVYDFVPHDASEFDLAILRDIATTLQQLIHARALEGQPA
ncbi:GAF domain-containing protein [uncultured Amnibacterium sp.]|uniref:GAF domain-containing protein n=1 Tax=uncultured Amnibacterium sp. TaxID=1631851 RepID=UPI0035CACC3C